MAENVIMVCLAAIVLVSAFNIYKIIHNYKLNQKAYAEIADIAGATEFSGNIDFDSLSKINSDIVGWLYYDDTHINYPVVQGEDNDKYLYTGFNGTYRGCGTLFVDCITEKPFEQFNTIIYGHHMKDGTMFADFRYLKDPSYAEEHPQLELTTPEGKYHLLIWAFLNQPQDSEVYNTNFNDEPETTEYIEKMKSLAEYTTDVEVTGDDKLVILSTCAYEYQNARYMTICKMVPADE